MHNTIRSLTMTCVELRKGTISFVPRHLLLPVSDAVHRAIETSHHGRRTHPVAGTPFELFADLKCAAEGNTAYYIAAGISLRAIAAGTPLFIGTTASRLSTAPTAWRHVLRDYLAAVAAGRHGVTFCSFAGMPHKLPWACGYMTQESNGLTFQERDVLVTLARVAGLYLTDKGERESNKAQAAGRDFTPNPAEYPELL